MKDVRGKVAVVTGAASGIGRGMVEFFVAVGMKVVLADIETNPLEDLTRAMIASRADVHAVVIDVSKPEQGQELARRTLNKYGGCTRALQQRRNLGRRRSASLDGSARRVAVVDVNVMGAVNGVRSFLPIMIEQDTEAHIVNTASLRGIVSIGGAAYVATKSAVVGLSEAMYQQLQRGGFKPRVSVLCPGFVATNIPNSYRNRPAHIAPPAADPTAGALRKRQGMASESVRPSARTVGDQVLAAIRDEQFYILTHPELNHLIDQRIQRILQGNNPAVKTSPGLMRKSVR